MFRSFLILAILDLPGLPKHCAYDYSDFDRRVYSVTCSGPGHIGRNGGPFVKCPTGTFKKVVAVTLSSQARSGGEANRTFWAGTGFDPANYATMGAARNFQYGEAELNVGPGLCAFQ